MCYLEKFDTDDIFKNGKLNFIENRSHKMLVAEKQEAKMLIEKLPDSSSFEDIQYHIYVAEKLKRSRENIKEGKLYTQDEVEKRLEKWIIK